MTDVKTFAGSGFILLAMLSMAGQARAGTVTLSTSTPTQIIAGTTYQFNDMTFSFSCSTECGSLALLGVSDSAGSGIAIEGDSSPSAIFSGAAGGAEDGITLGVTVKQIAGSSGISSVTNIVNGSLAVPADKTLISSEMTSFSNPLTNLSTTSATSNLSTPSTTVDFTDASDASFSFDDQILDSTGRGTPGDTLTLKNVTFIFQPAPEPASIALFATGLTGLTAARRRFFRRVKQ